MSDKILPIDFSLNLSRFVTETKSHVATLNYDNLLYDSFKSEVLKGYGGSLIDGFLRDGFNENNLKRKHPDKLGWYMHLHGSPLFVGNTKLMGRDRRYRDPDENCHIILTHVRHKPLLIESSHVLKTYWKYLDVAISESSRIILFGYSGDDIHLNERIRKISRNKELLIVEWNGSGSLDERMVFWKSKTGFSKISLVHLDNILSFRNW